MLCSVLFCVRLLCVMIDPVSWMSNETYIEVLVLHALAYISSCEYCVFCVPFLILCLLCVMNDAVSWSVIITVFESIDGMEVFF